VSDTFFVPAPPPALTFNVSFFAPVVVGLKDTLIVQLPPAASDAPHVVLFKYCPGFVPVSVMLVIGTATELVFCTVTGCAALLLPTVWLPNVKDVGDTV
jgi:hypothetical protein